MLNWTELRTNCKVFIGYHIMVGFDANKSQQFTSRDYEIAGAVSGSLTRLFLQPLDVLKIRFQLQLEPLKRSYPTAKYYSMHHAITTIYKEEGFRSLWKGHVPAQGLSVVYGVVQFACFENLTANLHPYLPQRISTGSLKPLYHFLCGGVAGSTAAVSAHPLDVIRTRFVSQGEPKIYRNIFHATHCMYKEAGVRTFYKGLLPTLIQVYPYAGFQFAFYAFLNKIWNSFFMQATSEKSMMKSLVCGCLSGIGAKTLVYPLDLAKKRLQVQGFEKARMQFGRVQFYDGLISCLRTVLREEGIFALFKGLRASIVKAGLSTALTFTFYESTLHFLANRHSRSW